MQLDRLAVQLRLRNPWEAMDLGFAMTRSWMPQVYGAWFAVAVPLFALALAVLPVPWATTLLWWLKPALDRVVLHVLGSGVFGDLPGVRATLRALPRALTPGLLASLTWLRFAPARSFNLAVWQLERQRGRAARTRLRQLQRRVGGNAVWLTAVCVHFELALGLSFVALYDLLLPAGNAEDVGLFQLFYGASPATLQWAMALTYFAVVTLIEPAYVAAGFALYLNRRTALEGWDLELALRRVEQRLARGAQPPASEVREPAPSSQPSPSPAILGVLVCAGILALLPNASPSYAQQPPAAQAPAAGPDPQEEIKKIYQRPELNPYAERTRIEYIGARKPRRNARAPWSWGDVLGEAAGQILRILAWAVVGLVLVFLLYYLLRHLDLLGRERRPRSPPPSVLFGLDVRPESLPQDPAAAAARLAQEGRVLEALSLLYRAALATLLHRDGVELSGGDTEADCLRKSRTRVPQPAHVYFSSLLSAWQRAAYARREVPGAEVEQLCREWPLHFDAQRSASGAAQ